MIKGDKPIFDRFAVIFSIAIVWIYAHLFIVGGAYKNSEPKTQITCRTDHSGIIGGAPWIRVPYPFQWGEPTFDAGELFPMMAEHKISIYGMKQSEWDQLARWIVNSFFTVFIIIGNYKFCEKSFNLLHIIRVYYVEPVSILFIYF
ncbi:Nucleobase-ascorbate transporter 7 [Stylosanthes scabra]|uniref:Nucleobase-ascorbate transporter 7 n=1 Tax=Stylosanthes scabra TaxID=79078 RepID=A0ABU6RVH1_9FABA|nr:Nucleobase-ascorbate transporter 7 [Stylosanthes scabra]